MVWVADIEDAFRDVVWGAVVQIQSFINFDLLPKPNLVGVDVVGLRPVVQQNVRRSAYAGLVLHVQCAGLDRVLCNIKGDAAVVVQPFDLGCGNVRALKFV